MLTDEFEISWGTDPMKLDTDGDGYADSIDALPLDSNEWKDTDGDGRGDNSDILPNFSRYQDIGDLMLDLLIIVLIVGSISTLVTTQRRRNVNPEGLSESTIRDQSNSLE